jgi:hypothetical protein
MIQYIQTSLYNLYTQMSLSSDDDKWEYAYGRESERLTRFIMAGGGSHAWNYVVYFDEEGDQTQVKLERYPFHEENIEKISGKLIANEDEDGNIRIVPDDYECKDNEYVVSYSP